MFSGFSLDVFCVEDALDITTVIIIEIERAIMGARTPTEIRTMRVTATGIISRNIAIHMTGEWTLNDEPFQSFFPTMN